MEADHQILDYEESPWQDPNQYVANTGQRFVHFIVDRIFSYLFVGILAFLLAPLDAASVEGELSTGLTLFLLLMFPGYYILFEYFLGKTPGKSLTRTKVVTETGAKPTFLNIVGRTLCRYIPFEPFSFLGSKPTGWHDTISKTLVVKQDYPVQVDEFV